MSEERSLVDLSFPIGSMGLVYLPTWMVVFNGKIVVFTQVNIPVPWVHHGYMNCWNRLKPPRFVQFFCWRPSQKTMLQLPNCGWSAPQSGASNRSKLEFFSKFFEVSHVGSMYGFIDTLSPKDHWTLKTGYLEDPNPTSYRFFHPSIGGSKILRVWHICLHF